MTCMFDSHSSTNNVNINILLSFLILVLVLFYKISLYIPISLGFSSNGQICDSGFRDSAARSSSSSAFTQRNTSVNIAQILSSSAKILVTCDVRATKATNSKQFTSNDSVAKEIHNCRHKTLKTEEM